MRRYDAEPEIVVYSWITATQNQLLMAPTTHAQQVRPDVSTGDCKTTPPQNTTNKTRASVLEAQAFVFLSDAL